MGRFVASKLWLANGVHAGAIQRSPSPASVVCVASLRTVAEFSIRTLIVDLAIHARIKRLAAQSNAFSTGSALCIAGARDAGIGTEETFLGASYRRACHATGIVGIACLGTVAKDPVVAIPHGVGHVVAHVKNASVRSTEYVVIALCVSDAFDALRAAGRFFAN